MELSRWYAEEPFPGITLRVVFTGAEEPFLAGSRNYASRAIPSDGVEAYVGCLNLDMVAVGDSFILKAEPGSIWLDKSLAAATDATVTPFKTDRLMPSSDHWAFHEAGIQSAQLTRGADLNWHHPSDTPDRVTQDALDSAVKVAQALIISYLKAIS
jgi:Zn-dependent M28 family amino/carboxypeptidase